MPNKGGFIPMYRTVPFLVFGFLCYLALPAIAQTGDSLSRTSLQMQIDEAARFVVKTTRDDPTRSDGLLLFVRSNHSGNPEATKGFWHFLINDGLWATVLLNGATVYDSETTFAALNRCRDCYEANPVMRPFVEAGRPALYAFNASANLGNLYIAYRVKQQEEHPTLQKLWWIPPVSWSVAHILAGSLNLRFVF